MELGLPADKLAASEGALDVWEDVLSASSRGADYVSVTDGLPIDDPEELTTFDDDHLEKRKYTYRLTPFNEAMEAGVPVTNMSYQYNIVGRPFRGQENLLLAQLLL